MRSVEAIQNLVFGAFETMLRQPEMFTPCSVIEFEARLSSYLWMLAVSDEHEQAWAETLEQLRIEKDWPSPLDIVGSVERDTGSSDDQKNIEVVIEFYADFAQRLGYQSDDEALARKC